MEKKDKVITFRTDAETKLKLDNIAKEKSWSISLVIEKIIKKYFETTGGTDNEL